MKNWRVPGLVRAKPVSGNLRALGLAVDAGLFVLIWLVQLIIYPSLRHVEPAHFAAWHADYSNRITLVVGPLMLAQLALAGYSVIVRPNGLTVVHLGIVLLLWAATLFVSVPIHNQLQLGGKSLSLIDQLVWTNWLRTAGWTVLFLLALYAAVDFNPASK
jgi:hypothetical protein